MLILKIYLLSYLCCRLKSPEKMYEYFVFVLRCSCVSSFVLRFGDVFLGPRGVKMHPSPLNVQKKVFYLMRLNENPMMYEELTLCMDAKTFEMLITNYKIKKCERMNLELIVVCS